MLRRISFRATAQRGEISSTCLGHYLGRWSCDSSANFVRLKLCNWLGRGRRGPLGEEPFGCKDVLAENSKANQERSFHRRTSMMRSRNFSDLVSSQKISPRPLAKTAKRQEQGKRCSLTPKQTTWTASDLPDMRPMVRSIGRGSALRMVHAHVDNIGCWLCKSS